ncbi:MAG: C-terminal target protein [Acidobacteria bacterium]|nr:C-terminal target protein [Acidobacteriota bacterium]
MNGHAVRNVCCMVKCLAPRLLVLTLTFAVIAPLAHATETLCDPSAQNCRDQLMTLIQNEHVGIDVGFWFMQDSRYETAIVGRWKAGVPVRILVDPRANPTYTGNSTMLSDFAAAGIPMRKRTASGILHWKMMLFAGQNTVEFGSANYSPNAFVPNTPYIDYVDETILFTDDPPVVDSFKTKFDDSWTDTTNFASYANVTVPLSRTYPTYAIDPDLNFPPGQDFANRSVPLYKNEKQKIDVIMYRITDQRHTNAIISAFARGVPVRMIVENIQYHNPQYLWDAWNVDRLYAAGIPLRWRGHSGENHEKVTLLYGQGLAIFGSSNWTGASANSQQEHNYFTTKAALFQWFESQFERMWTNSNPANATETVPFVPLPPQKPVMQSPANGASISTTNASLTWYAGPWGAVYDIYFGTTPTPPLLASNVNLGPSVTSTSYQKYTTPTLAAGTTYYWQIVSKTMAGLTATGPLWSFTTTGTSGGSGGGTTSGSVPAPWTHADVGAVGQAGSASESGGTFTVSGAGADVWGTADAFHYVYQPLSGDGQLVARVATVQNTAAWAKAGVMIRNSTNPSAAFALMLISAGKGSAFQYRTSDGASASGVAGAATTVAPQWVKIVRSGATVSGYQSANGTTWQLVGTVTLSLGASVDIGLAVSSHTTAALCTATFDNVAP